MHKPFVYRWRDALAQSPDLSTGERAVGWRMADYANGAGTSVRPGHVRLARDCGFKVAPNAVKHDVVGRAIKRLVDLGFVTVVSSGHQGRAAEYQLTMPTNRATPESPYSPNRATPQSR